MTRAEQLTVWLSPHGPLSNTLDQLTLDQGLATRPCRGVCCYPDYERLLTAAADHAKRLLVFSHPPRNWWSRTFTHLQSVGFRLMSKSFRTFAHPPVAMVAVAEARGMHTEYSYRGSGGSSA